MNFVEKIGIEYPIIQAPMAGVSTPALAAAVSNAGGLGSLGIGASNPAVARKMIEDLRALTPHPFNVNVFVHSPAVKKPQIEERWVESMRPLFAAYAASPPATLNEIYKSFAHDAEMVSMLVELAPKVVSFHFGLPDMSVIDRLKDAGCILLSTATNRDEAARAVDHGIDAIVAQGYEAGGHRGVFDPSAPDEHLDTAALTRQLLSTLDVPVIAAGGIMDGKAIRGMLELGAAAVQLGTAFISCPESSADDGYRAAMRGAGLDGTVITDVISGRPARCIKNKFTEWGYDRDAATAIPDYPIAYDAGKALNAAAKASGEYGYGAQWAGTGVHKCRPMPASELMKTLLLEMNG